MSAAILLKKLEQLGVRVTVAGDRLRLQPASVIPQDMVEEIRARKTELTRLLAEQPPEWHAQQVVQEAPNPGNHLPAGTGDREREMVAEAFRRADRVNNALDIIDERIRAINRLGWAICDLQDGGAPEQVWQPLRRRKEELCDEFYGRKPCKP